MAMIDEVSRAEKIPKSFLAKIFQDLGRSGLVRSNRRARGGFTLAKKPEDITVLEIIEAIEGRIIFQRCRLDQPDCKRVGGCALCALFERTRDGVKDALTGTTLEDLIRQKEGVAAGTRRQSTAAGEKTIQTQGVSDDDEV